MATKRNKTIKEIRKNTIENENRHIIIERIYLSDCIHVFIFERNKSDNKLKYVFAKDYNFSKNNISNINKNIIETEISNDIINQKILTQKDLPSSNIKRNFIIDLLMGAVNFFASFFTAKEQPNVLTANIEAPAESQPKPVKLVQNASVKTENNKNLVVKKPSVFSNFLSLFSCQKDQTKSYTVKINPSDYRMDDDGSDDKKETSFRLRA